MPFNRHSSIITLTGGIDAMCRPTMPFKIYHHILTAYGTRAGPGNFKINRQNVKKEEVCLK